MILILSSFLQYMAYCTKIDQLESRYCMSIASISSVNCPIALSELVFSYGILEFYIDFLQLLNLDRLPRYGHTIQ